MLIGLHVYGVLSYGKPLTKEEAFYYFYKVITDCVHFHTKHCVCGLEMVHQQGIY